MSECHTSYLLLLLYTKPILFIYRKPWRCKTAFNFGIEVLVHYISFSCWFLWWRLLCLNREPRKSFSCLCSGCLAPMKNIRNFRRFAELSLMRLCCKNYCLWNHPLSPLFSMHGSPINKTSIPSSHFKYKGKLTWKSESGYTKIKENAKEKYHAIH